MKLSMIAAVSNNFVIGKEGKLPWSVPEDLLHFRRLTINKTVIMGRKTHDTSLHGGFLLTDRMNIVLSRTMKPWELKANKTRNTSGLIVESVYEALFSAETYTNARLAKNPDLSDEVFIIGGAEIYLAFIPFVTKIYMTVVDTVVTDGDTFFPKEILGNWTVDRTQIRMFPKDEVYNIPGYVTFVMERSHQGTTRLPGIINYHLDQERNVDRK